MSILGVEYSKNNTCYKKLKIGATKRYKSSIKRIMSIFKTGLFLLNKHLILLLKYGYLLLLFYMIYND